MSFEGDPGHSDLSNPVFEDLPQDARENLEDVHLPPHETLIINDQPADIGEAIITPSDTETADYAEEVPLDRAISSWALAQAGRSTDQKAYVAEHSGDPEIAEEVYQGLQTQRWDGRDELGHIKVLAHRSTLPDGDQAWAETVDALTNASSTYEKQEIIHPAELVVPHQSDPERLQQIIEVAEAATSGVLRVCMLRGIAVQQAKIDDIEGALGTIRAMGTEVHEASENADEALVAVADYWARNPTGNLQANAMIEGVYQEMSPKMSAWATIKIAATRGISEQTRPLWIQADINLSNEWGKYGLRQRCAIVDDLVQAGQLDMAERYTTTLLPMGGGTAADRDLQTGKLFDIAHTKAAYNMNEGLDTITRLKAHLRKEIITYGRIGATQTHREKITTYNNTVINRADAHKVAILAQYSSQEAALESLSMMTFGDNISGPYRDEALAIASVGFAEGGDTDMAVSLATKIGWYPFTNVIKSTAYADIARVTRARRLAAKNA